MASGHTFGKVFRVLDGTVFEQCFRRWVASIVGMAEGVVAFDGKTLGGSKDGPNTALPPRRWASHWGRKARRARAMNWWRSKRCSIPWYSKAASSPSTQWGVRQTSQQRRGLGVSYRLAFLRRLAPTRCLNPVSGADAFERFGGDRRAVRHVHIKELAPHMRLMWCTT
jgi:hypothetical protein